MEKVPLSSLRTFRHGITLLRPANSALAVITIRAAKKVIWNEFHCSIITLRSTPYVMLCKYIVDTFHINAIPDTGR